MKSKQFLKKFNCKEPACQAGDTFDPWVEKSPGEGTGNPLQYSCLGNPVSRGVWWTTVHGLTEVSDMTW